MTSCQSSRSCGGGALQVCWDPIYLTWCSFMTGLPRLHPSPPSLHPCKKALSKSPPPPPLSFWRHGTSRNVTSDREAVRWGAVQSSEWVTPKSVGRILEQCEDPEWNRRSYARISGELSDGSFALLRRPCASFAPTSMGLCRLHTELAIARFSLSLSISLSLLLRLIYVCSQT